MSNVLNVANILNVAPRAPGQSEESLDVLQKITYKWGLQIYYNRGRVDQIYFILKTTCNKGRLTSPKKAFKIEELSLINVEDDSIQNDWEIAREILCKTNRSPKFYEIMKTRLEIELAGNVFEILPQF